ncbi:MAG TPA: phenylacetate--CoA ligase [Planctomycetota bacterium]|jgi:phenylacetate-CoA ligase
MAIYDEKHEKMPRLELRQLQIERLQSTLNRVCRNVAFYRRMFEQHRIEPERIKSIEALQQVPFTTKEDLRRCYPYDMFAVPLRDVVRIQSTSGTTGKPIGIGYTENDLRHWTELMARVLSAADVTHHDCVQVAFQYSLFTGGFGFHQGAERLKASVIPSSSAGTLRRQIEIMRDFKSTVLCCSPSYAVRLATALEELGEHPEKLQLRCGLFGAEPWSENLRAQLEERLHLKAFDTYGLSELMGPGVASECQQHSGLHVNEDHFIVEVIDPATGAPLRPGEKGELVFTTITREAFPLVRYRTGDIASLDETPCGCGRTLARISRVCGRTDDMVFAQGIKFFPSEIEDALLNAEGVTPHFEIELHTSHGEDIVEIRAELTPALASADKQALLEKVSTEIETAIGLKAKVAFQAPGSIPVSEGKKVIRIIDQRRN